MCKKFENKSKKITSSEWYIFDNLQSSQNLKNFRDFHIKFSCFRLFSFLCLETTSFLSPRPPRNLNKNMLQFAPIFQRKSGKTGAPACSWLSPQLTDKKPASERGSNRRNQMILYISCFAIFVFQKFELELEVFVFLRDKSYCGSSENCALNNNRLHQGELCPCESVCWFISPAVLAHHSVDVSFGSPLSPPVQNRFICLVMILLLFSA